MQSTARSPPPYTVWLGLKYSTCIGTNSTPPYAQRPRSRGSAPRTAPRPPCGTGATRALQHKCIRPCLSSAVRPFLPDMPHSLCSVESGLMITTASANVNMFGAVASDGGGVGCCRTRVTARGLFFYFRSSVEHQVKGHEAEGIQHGRLSLLAAGQASIMLVPTTPLRTRSRAHSRNPNVGCLVPEDVGFGVDLYDFWHGEYGNGCGYRQQPCRGVPLLIRLRGNTKMCKDRFVIRILTHFPILIVP